MSRYSLPYVIHQPQAVQADTRVQVGASWFNRTNIYSTVCGSQKNQLCILHISSMGVYNIDREVTHLQLVEHRRTNQTFGMGLMYLQIQIEVCL